MSARPMMAVSGAAPRPGMPGRSVAQTAAQLKLSQAQVAQQFMQLLSSFTATLDGEPAYLEPGAQGRLALSLRSGIPQEQDFALQRLLQASNFDPELLPLQHHQFLVDALVDVIEVQIERRRNELGVNPWATNIRADSSDGGIRRACEAALILRNLSTIPQNAHIMQQQPALFRLLRTIVEALELGLPHHAGEYDTPGPSDGDVVDELKIYMLEILAVLAPSIRLEHSRPGDIPPTGPSVSRSSSRGAKRRLLPLLTALSYSPDRAVVVLSLSILADFARRDAHDALFSSAEATAIARSPLTRALELLPLQDSEINTAALDYLYAATNSIQVSIALTDRPQFPSILRHLLFAITRSGEMDLFETDLRTNVTPRKKSTPVVSQDAAVGGNTRLPQPVLESLLPIPEPQRTIHWMQYVYEPGADAEIAQVELWKSYLEEFQAYDKTHKMMAAADVIKHTTEAFPMALPMVATDAAGGKKFIIRGIRQRHRRDLAHTFRCQWKLCSDARNPSRQDGNALYLHLRDAHIGNSAQTDGKCQWADCRYVIPQLQTLSSEAQAQITHNALALHARTHVPVLATGAEKKGQTATTQETVPSRIVRVERGADGVPAGRGFLAAFALRNIARAIRTGLASGHDLDRGVGSMSDLVAAIAGPDEIAAEEAAATPVRMSLSAAKKAAGAFISLESELLGLLMESADVVNALSEVLDVLGIAHATFARDSHRMEIG